MSSLQADGVCISCHRGFAALWTSGSSTQFCLESILGVLVARNFSHLPLLGSSVVRSVSIHDFWESYAAVADLEGCHPEEVAPCCK